MKKNGRMEWNQEEKDYLATRKQAGDSASLIAADLGCTRSAVMSKARSLTLGEWDSTTVARIGKRRRDEVAEERGVSRKQLAQEREAREAARKKETERIAKFRADKQRLSKQGLHDMLAEACRNTAAL